MKVEIEKEELDNLKAKAEHYETIQDKIAEFYSEESEEEGCDLTDIGEWIAGYFNWM